MNRTARRQKCKSQKGITSANEEISTYTMQKGINSQTTSCLLQFSDSGNFWSKVR